VADELAPTEDLSDEPLDALDGCLVGLVSGDCALEYLLGPEKAEIERGR